MRQRELPVAGRASTSRGIAAPLLGIVLLTGCVDAGGATCVPLSVDTSEKRLVEERPGREPVPLLLRIRDPRGDPVADVPVQVELQADGAGRGTKANHLRTDERGVVSVDLAQKARFAQLRTTDFTSYTVFVRAYQQVNGVTYCISKHRGEIAPAAP